MISTGDLKRILFELAPLGTRNECDLLLAAALPLDASDVRRRPQFQSPSTSDDRQFYLRRRSRETKGSDVSLKRSAEIVCQTKMPSARDRNRGALRTFLKVKSATSCVLFYCPLSALPVNVKMSSGCRVESFWRSTVNELGCIVFLHFFFPGCKNWLKSVRVAPLGIDWDRCLGLGCDRLRAPAVVRRSCSGFRGWPKNTIHSAARDARGHLVLQLLSQPSSASQQVRGIASPDASRFGRRCQHPATSGRSLNLPWLTCRSPAGTR
jgi:hypothetical protein